ncbi:hypothetical protein GGI19_003746 [Coemansia pectinata]|uniref:t-SNARE coiled-coil homology domain-containing protein n=1 Tax=Coemansia pectinata TaxID=1052879 RepID=A0A9W8GZ13_9FUNG|nr:hypothetical protein GGI19_003746 [Coemansia pectinata]
MNRNRFSEFIARRNEGSGDDSQPPGSPESLDDVGASEDMEKYLTALGGIERDIAATSNGVDELGVLHGRLLSTADGAKAEAVAQQRDQKTRQLNDQIEKLKGELGAVDQMNESTALSPSDRAKRRGRHAVLVRRLMGVLDKYRALERESQKRYRTRMEKHIRLVRPDATDEEVAEAATNEASRSVFAMDVMSSYRSKVAKRMLRDVENRDRDIRNIGNTIELLNRMFVDMQEAVAQQQDVLDNIEQAVDDTYEYTTGAVAEKMWWIIFFVALIIIAIALGVTLPLAINKRGNGRSNSGSSGESTSQAA